MDFGLSEEQEMLQETLRSFAEKECPTTRLRELFDAGRGQDPALWSGLSEMGITGLAVPETWGGAGLELLDVALAAEVLGHAGMPGPFLGHSIAVFGVLASGSEAEQASILPEDLGDQFLRDVIQEVVQRHGAPFVADYVRLDIWAERGA